MDAWVLGRITYDLFALDLGKPLPEVERFSRHLGGSSANIAVGLARLGLTVGMIGCVGDDLLADYLIGFLNDAGIDTRFVKRAGGYGTQLCLGEVRPPFRQVFYRHKPADTQLRVGPAELDAIRAARLFVTNGTSLSESPSREATVDALRAAKRAGVQTVFDMDYRESSWPSSEQAGAVARSALGLVDTLIANEGELLVLTADTRSPRATERVLGAGPSLLVLKLGAAGVEAHGAGGVVAEPPIEVEAVSTVGAGDGFAAGFLAATLQGRPLPECLRYGNAAAAIVVSRVSCSDAMPRPGEIAALLARTD